MLNAANDDSIEYTRERGLVLEEPQNPAERVHTGQQMAAILEQLANMNAFAEIADPAAWERTIRSDRVLVDRDS